ncbi:hypothetical protein I6F35_04875 [Bradyrhizobium sp. BRP22]|nr:hypothetical protein [Bradyrhizobium sp. BRP22]
MLAPGAALAVGNPAPCLPAEVALAADDAHPGSGQSLHDHGSHEHDGAHAAHHADSGDVKHKHDGKTAPGPCCAMLCLSAMAADLPGIAKPTQPISTCVSETYQRLRGTAPPLPYRPPNA